MSDDPTANNGSNGAPHSNGRGPGGRFTVGNSYAKGNSVHQRMFELRRELLEAVDPETIRKVIAKLGTMAMEGDTAAAKLYLEHSVGRPAQSIELTGLGGADADVAKLRAVVLSALADDPAARFKVARALLAVGTDDERGDNAGNGA